MTIDDLRRATDAFRPSLRAFLNAYDNLIYGKSSRRTPFAPDYLHLRSIKRFVQDSLLSAHEGMELLDLGCGDQRYREAIRNGVLYIGMDYPVTRDKYYLDGPLPDVLGTAEDLPFRSGCMNVILCTEVLEHVADAPKTLREIRRVLKPDGKAIVSLPFLFPEHNEPFDYRRFTANGIMHELNLAGLGAFEVRKLGGPGTVLVSIFVRYLHSVLHSTYLGKVLFYIPGCLMRPPGYFLLNAMGIMLDACGSQSLYAGIGILCGNIPGEKPLSDHRPCQ